MSFDGVDDFVSVANSTSLDITGTRVTLSAWVFMDEAPAADVGVVVKSSFSNATRYEYQLVVDGAAFFEIAAAADFRTRTTMGLARVGSAAPLETGKWQHLAGVYDGANVLIYVDGVLVGSEPQTGTILSNTEPLLVGRRALNDERYFKGLIDEVRVYDGALSQSEIQSDMNTSVSGGSPRP